MEIGSPPPPDGEGGHREAVGALPLLASTTPPGRRRHPDDITDLFLRANMLYLGDFRDFSRLTWFSKVEIWRQLSPLQPTPTKASVWRRFTTLRKRFTDNHEPEVEALRTNRLEHNPPDGPKVGEIWADPTTTPLSVGIVTAVDSTQSGPVHQGGDDRNECPCMADRRMELAGGLCVTVPAQ